MTYEQYTYFLYCWIAFAIAIFILLHFVTAPYGRHTKTTWGPLISNRLAWIIMEIVVFGVIYYHAFSGVNKQSLVNIIILSLFTLHYLHRSLIYPFRIKTKGKKMPVIIMLMGVTFNLISGFTIGYYLGNFRVYEISWLWSAPFIIGTVLFFIGMIINWRSDTILLNLRKPGETGYKIPYGGMFKYVSAPNLLGETLEWFGYAVLMWSLPGFAFFIWTFANLIPRALSHHEWYKDHFPDYPKERKAVIPYVL